VSVTTVTPTVAAGETREPAGRGGRAQNGAFVPSMLSWSADRSIPQRPGAVPAGALVRSVTFG